MALGDSPLKKKQVSIWEKSSRFLVFFMLGFVLLFVDSLGVFTPVYRGVGLVAAPIQYYIRISRTWVTEFTYTFSNIGGLKGKIADLKRDKVKLESRIVELSKYESDAEELRKQLGIKQQEGFELVEADIIGGDASGAVSVFRINRGKDHGLKFGMPVVTEGILVGRIEEVYNTVSKVSFLTDLESNVPALNERSRHKGIVHGSLEGLIMEDILQKEDIKVGDKIITLGDKFPVGLLIGSVQKIVTTETSSKKSAILEPTADYRSLEKVFVITSYDLSDTFNPEVDQ